MTSKILCPFHEEVTPSCTIYGNRFYCFGCGRHGDISELGYTIKPTPEKPKEDLNESLSFIKKLPIREIRGLNLPCSETHYYIVWPINEFNPYQYYTKRAIDPADKIKYINPSGHSTPLYVPQTGNKGLILVEGQINALSLTKVLNGYTIVSPGGTGQFTEKTLLPLIKNNTFSRCYLFVDKDAAGSEAVLRSQPILVKWVRVLKYGLLEKDFNDILVQNGKESLRKIVEKSLEM